MGKFKGTKFVQVNRENLVHLAGRLRSAGDALQREGARIANLADGAGGLNYGKLKAEAKRFHNDADMIKRKARIAYQLANEVFSTK